MATFSIDEAKTHLSKLIQRVLAGEEIILVKGGSPIAKIVPLDKVPEPRKPGLDRGRIKISPDFDSPLPAEIEDEFYR